MIILSIVIGFVIGVFFTIWLFQDEIFNGRKVGYGPNDIHPDSYGSCCRHVPPAQHKPPIAPKKQ